LFYYQSGVCNFSGSEQSWKVLSKLINPDEFFSSKTVLDQQACFTSSHPKFYRCEGFSINGRYVFFWNIYNVWYFDTQTILDEQKELKFDDLGLQVSGAEK
jgi:hypothetical protein